MLIIENSIQFNSVATINQKVNLKSKLESYLVKKEKLNLK